MVSCPRVSRLLAFASSYGVKATRSGLVKQARSKANPYDNASAMKGMQQAIAAAATLDEVLGDCAKIVAVIASHLEKDTFHCTMSVHAQAEEMSVARAIP